MNSCQNSSSSLFKSVAVWAAGENDVDGYRIPGIVVTPQGTALAFAEERNEFGDADPKSLVLKRSIDQGESWSDNIYIEVNDGSFWANNQNQHYLTTEKGKREVWTNIAPLVDKITGRIFFFYALSEGDIEGQNLQRYTRVFYKYSEDDGLTWSNRVEVTQVLNSKKDGTPNQGDDGNWIVDENGFPCDYMGRAFHMPGPGHGIQLSNGRLLLQVWNRKALGILHEGKILADERKYGVCTIYSDDHGTSWKYGSSFGEEFNLNESRMAQLSNGDVYLNGRYTNDDPKEKNNHRVIAISKDHGMQWDVLGIDKNFPKSNQCDGSVIAMNYNQQDYLLYSKNESLEGRKNLVVRLSEDNGETWPIAKTIDKGNAMYSDMAVLPDKSVLVLYEKGKNKALNCIRLNIEWLKTKG
ncbi:sialidase family protein [Membranihabitans marinus]|uniref:sialidase family protein n=1 Tax=Membranihabitans marinus TaxID=1227546 RepID=UPI001F3520D0|nr:sialidase family protein [Membranihabitans marinus]